MKNTVQVLLRWGATGEFISLSLIFSILVLLASLFLGMTISVFSPACGVAVAGALVIAIIVLLRLDELTVALIVAVRIWIDWYFGLHLVAMLMALVLLFVCYFGRSTEHPWTRPRSIWLWVLFLILTIYPTIRGNSSMLAAASFYVRLVLSAFVMFWLGNTIAKDISAVRRVFQLLSVLAALIAIHTIIQATTGRFLFESTRAEADLFQYLNFQLIEAGVSRSGSFFINPNGNADFLAISFFLPFGLFMESKSLWAKMVYLLEMLLILLALMCTYSTGGWIAVLASLLAFVFFIGRIRYGALALILVVALAVIAFTVFPSQIDAQLDHANDQSELSLHVGDWQTAVRVIEAFPLSGVGIGNQEYLVRAEPYRVPAQTVPLQEPDNSYLQWGAMAGIPVMLVFIFLLGHTFWFSWRNWLAMDTRCRPLLGGGIAALIALSVNSLTTDGWTDPAGLVNLGWLIAGIVASPLIGHFLVPPVDRTADSVHIQTKTSRMKETKQSLQNR